MKKRLVGTLAASVLLFAGCTSKEVASTEAGKIKEEDFIEQMKNEPLQGGMTVGQSVLQKMLLADAFEYKYGDKVSKEQVQKKYEEDAKRLGGVENFEKALEKQGLKKEYVKKNIRVGLLMQEAIKDHVEIKEEDLKKKYDEKKPFAKAQHILVKDEEKAKELIQKLNDGADFAELVKENTIDTASKDKEGVYTIAEGEMVPEFETAVKNLEVGQVTQEPVKTTHGFHVIKRLEFDEAKDFEEKKGEIKDQIINGYTKDSAFMSNMISELLADMNVQITDDELKPAIAPFLKKEDKKSDDKKEDKKGEDKKEDKKSEKDKESKDDKKDSKKEEDKK